MGVDYIQKLIEESRDRRKAQVSSALSMDAGYYQALKTADELMDRCIEVFKDGSVMEGFKTIYSMHPGEVNAALELIDKKFPLVFLEQTEQLVCKP